MQGPRRIDLEPALIGLSSQEFYQNDLFVHPSPMRGDDGLGLKFVHLPDTVSDRGKSMMNRGEARAVAAAVIAHARETPERSLGIGCFNVKQQEAILEELEALRREHPDLEDFFRAEGKEAFFVKNLETIQGDERDVIFLSIGYGRDANGRLTQNFGALNKEGGERRLNVLITRARYRCVVFSNFRASDLAVESTTPRGVQILKQFLTYAETGQIPSTTAPLEDPESPFEEEVRRFLADHGYQVHLQVGCAGFRIDLAIVDPEHPGEYIVGVECDGAMYHSSRVARDRDRLRQQVLEGLGWRIVRVWSTDWFQEPERSRERLVKLIEEKRREPKPDIAARPAAEVADAPEQVADSGEASLFESGTGEVVGDTAHEPDSTPEPETPSIADLAPAYTICSNLGTAGLGDNLLKCSPAGIAGLVARVVKVEGPVHRDIVVQRVRSAFGLKRAGKNVEAAVEAGIEAAVKQGKVKRSGVFLWPSSPPKVLVRRRGEEMAPAIDYICDEEIGAAALLVLQTQFATDRDELAVQALRVLGFGRVKSETKNRALGVIDGLISRGMAFRRDDDNIGLAAL